MLARAKLDAVIRKLRARRTEVLASLRLPEDGLPGSLSYSRRRCRSTGCHCQRDEGHLSWTLTFMVDRRKRVAHVPNELLKAVQRRVALGNAFKGAVAELMAINAQLLVSERQAGRRQKAVAAKKGRR